MKQALVLAKAAMANGEVPVGAVLTCGDRVVAQTYNLKETLHDPTAHAETLAIALAGKSLGRWILDDCTLYVTLEPCIMCAGAIIASRLPRIVYGASDLKAGACRSRYRLIDDPRFNHQATNISGLLEDESANLLSKFFADRR